MLLSDFIKALVEVAIDEGECEVVITTQNENQMYDNVLLHGLPFSNGKVLRIEGLDDETYESMADVEELNYGDDDEDYYDEEEDYYE